MNCESLEFDLPLFFDDVLSDARRISIEAHLERCPLCRIKISEFRALRIEFRNSPPIEISLELVASIRSTVGETIDSRAISFGLLPKKSFSETISYWLMPYSVGTLATLAIMLFLFVNLANNRNTIESVSLYETASPENTILLVSTRSDSPFESFPVAREGQTPQLNPAGALYQFTDKIVEENDAGSEVVILAAVFADGHAEIDEIVRAPQNQSGMRYLEEAFYATNTPFLPPNLDGNSKAVRVVFTIQRVDIYSEDSTS